MCSQITSKNVRESEMKENLKKYIVANCSIRSLCQKPKKMFRAFSDVIQTYNKYIENGENAKTSAKCKLLLLKIDKINAAQPIL